MCAGGLVCVCVCVRACVRAGVCARACGGVGVCVLSMSVCVRAKYVLRVR